MATVCWNVGIVSSILSLTCTVIALASSLWVQVRLPFFQNDIGLMRHCDMTGYCGDMEHLSSLIDPTYSGWFKSVQAMYLLHCLGMLVATVTYILYIVRFLEFKGSFRFLTIFNFLTLAAGIYAVAIFGTHIPKFFGVNPALAEDAAVFGYAFYTAIIGCCLSFLVMLVSALEAVHAVDLIQNMQNRLTVWTTPYTLFVDQEA